jgi:hypothetical protein
MMSQNRCDTDFCDLGPGYPTYYRTTESGEMMEEGRQECFLRIVPISHQTFDKNLVSLYKVKQGHKPYQKKHRKLARPQNRKTVGYGTVARNCRKTPRDSRPSRVLFVHFSRDVFLHFDLVSLSTSSAQKGCKIHVKTLMQTTLFVGKKVA